MATVYFDILNYTDSCIKLRSQNTNRLYSTTPQYHINELFKHNLERYAREQVNSKAIMSEWYKPAYIAQFESIIKDKLSAKRDEGDCDSYHQAPGYQDTTLLESGAYDSGTGHLMIRNIVFSDGDRRVSCPFNIILDLKSFV